MNKKEEKRVSVVTRTFQPGTGPGGKDFDSDYFSKRVKKPIENLLQFDEAVKRVVVVVNGEEQSKLGEIPDENGYTPSIYALKEAFSEAIDNGRMIIKLCKNWGPNPGSAVALNEGLELVKAQGDTSWVLNWSPEIEMDGYRVREALKHAEQRGLNVVGILRERYWERVQWQLPQNTACLWDIETLEAVDGFDSWCNNTGRTVCLDEHGEVSIAGMEDFHALLRIMKREDLELRWGMVGHRNPMVWHTDFEQNSSRRRRHLEKVARQKEVIDVYCTEVFEGLNSEDVMPLVYSCRYPD